MHQTNISRRKNTKNIIWITWDESRNDLSLSFNFSELSLLIL